MSLFGGGGWGGGGGLARPTRSLRRLVHTLGSWYRPPSLLREGLLTLMYIDSFTPLSNQLGSVVRICTDLSFTLWSGLSVWICLDTSDVTLLGLRCSLNRAFKDLSVSPMYAASHEVHGIWYTGAHTFSLGMVSFGRTSCCRMVLLGLKHACMSY